MSIWMIMMILIEWMNSVNAMYLWFVIRTRRVIRSDSTLEYLKDEGLLAIGIGRVQTIFDFNVHIDSRTNAYGLIREIRKKN